jgi:hypothetical protein
LAREENFMKQKTILPVLVIGVFLLSGCSIGGPTASTSTTPASDFMNIVSAETPIPVIVATFTPVYAPTATPVSPVASNVCSDPAVVSLIDSLKTSMFSADGALLSSLVTPNGMEVRYFRNGNPIMYTPYQASFLFETTFQANWGSDPASGIEKLGSFHDVIVPELVKIFNQPYTLHCNEIRHGGATYEVTLPYNKDFYSIYYIGTEANGFLDWHTWVVGVEYDNGKPYIYALMQFYWEP